MKKIKRLCFTAGHRTEALIFIGKRRFYTGVVLLRGGSLMGIFGMEIIGQGGIFLRAKKCWLHTQTIGKKIRRNIERDNEVNEYYQNNGWLVLRFSQVDIEKKLNDCIIKTIEAISLIKNN